MPDFHFHGDISEFPVTAAIIVPQDQKAEAILRGRYETHEAALQLVPARDVIEQLIATVYRIKRLFQSLVATVSIAAFLAIGLAFALSFRLRTREFQTNFLLGCSRWTTARLVGADLGGRSQAAPALHHRPAAISGARGLRVLP